MFEKIVKPMNLGSFSREEKEHLKTDYSQKKKVSKLVRESRHRAKRENCYFCGKPVTSFCKSHSIPRFCLENVSTNGDVLTLNTLVENPLMDPNKGIKEAGTFFLICNDCDNRIFSDYETPENYDNLPTSKMLAQIALKNALIAIYKRSCEIELYSLMAESAGPIRGLFDVKNHINEVDLQEYIRSFEKAKSALTAEDEHKYNLCYYEKLGYVVPIAFQSAIAMICDFEGNIINNIYNPSPEYKIQNINICVFPLKTESVIIMFVENEDTRYDRFCQQFNSLTLEDKLAALTFIMFAYSEEVYFSKTIENYVQSSEPLKKAGCSSTDMFALIPFFDPMKIIKKTYNLDQRHTIPNLLSKEYAL